MDIEIASILGGCLSSLNLRELVSYCPTVLILQPNQTLHIGKGRSHAFRKTTLDPLPEDDCHHLLRDNLVRVLKQADPNIQVAPLCYSIAYDWYVL